MFVICGLFDDGHSDRCEMISWFWLAFLQLVMLNTFSGAYWPSVCLILKKSLFYTSLGLQGDPTSPFWRRSALGFLWKEWCWSWNSSTLATLCEELTHWKRLWCWERLGVGGEGDDRGWDGWMASLTRWTWVWVISRSWWWTGRPGVLRFMGSQRVGHDRATELTDWLYELFICFGYSSLLIMSFANIFSHSTGCIFVDSLCCAKAFDLN